MESKEEYNFRVFLLLQGLRHKHTFMCDGLIETIKHDIYKIEKYVSRIGRSLKEDVTYTWNQKEHRVVYHAELR